MKCGTWKALASVLFVVPLSLTGCTEMSQQDVSDARDAVHEEQRETEEARQEAAENVRVEQRETEQARREALKPTMDENVLEEERETEEARQAGREKIREEQQETREAERAARETEARFNAQQTRDAFVMQVEAKLKVADARIEELQQQGEKLEGPAKEENAKQINELQTRRERVQEALGDLKSAELLQWRQSQDRVERAIRDLEREIEESR